MRRVAALSVAGVVRLSRSFHNRMLVKAKPLVLRQATTQGAHRRSVIPCSNRSRCPIAAASTAATQAGGANHPNVLSWTHPVLRTTRPQHGEFVNLPVVVGGFDRLEATLVSLRPSVTGKALRQQRYGKDRGTGEARRLVDTKPGALKTHARPEAGAC